MRLWDRILNTVVVNVAWTFVYIELKGGFLMSLAWEWRY